MVHVKKLNFTFSSKEKGIEQYLVILSLAFVTKLVLSGIKNGFLSQRCENTINFLCMKETWGLFITAWVNLAFKTWTVT